ncbi:hypothetical protein PG2103B_0548 [Bifidobacterium pseudolongum subsp. globosum]|nr:hypothetical protein PG2103B_0548 [Bifidobacterium pseudolongum subsp. globosum]
MNIYARVRCRCYDDGMLKPGPVPFSDLYLDEEDTVCSQNIDAAEMDDAVTLEEWKRDWEALSAAYEQWRQYGACAHEDMAYCSAWLGNTGDVAEYIELIDSLNRRHWYDGLLTHVPVANFTQLAPETCQSLIGELKSLIGQVEKGHPDRCQQGCYLFGERLLKLMQASAEVGNPLQLLY